MGPTRIGNLVAVALVVALTAYVLVRTWYGDIPDLPWLPSITIVALALTEGIAARATRARIERRPGAHPVEPLLVARLVALAKASSVVGAILVGAWAGAFAYTFAQRSRLSSAGPDSLVAAIGAAAALLLVGAALWLENSCRTPEPPEEEEDVRSGA
jgi:hypothetical protein